MCQVNMFQPAKMGLTNVKRLNEALGSPASSISAVHVAGTNGKVPLLAFVFYLGGPCSG